MGASKEIRFDGRVAIVTGAGGGLGRVYALEFGRRGAKVVVNDFGGARDGSGEGAAGPADKVVDEIKALGGEAVANYANVATPDGGESIVKSAVDAFGKVDILVNNAGITRDAQFVKFKDGQMVGQMSEEAFDLVVAVNLKGVFNCTQAVVPYMIKNGGGVVLNASSVVGLYGNFGQTNYAATKFGVIGMTKTWARELGKYKIRVNAVCPGFILTDMVLKMPENVLAAMAAKSPLGRLGTPEEIANTYLWLASDESSYVHGTAISVDGGVIP